MDPEIIATLNSQLNDLNQLLAKQSASLSGFSKSISSTKTSIDSASTTATQAITMQNLHSQKNLQQIAEINARTRAMAEADEILAKRTSNLQSAIRSTKNSLSQVKDAVLSGEQGFGKYGGALSGLGDASISIGKNFGILGTVIGTVFGVELKVAAQMAKQADDVAKATDTISKLGAVNVLSMDAVLDMGHKAGLTSAELEKMTKPMQSVQGGFVGLGKTQGEGVKKFGELLNVTEKTRTQYRHLGLDDEARNQAYADFISALNASGSSFQGELQNQHGLQKAADAYITNLYELSYLSGKSVDELGKERQNMMGTRAAILETMKLDKAEAKAQDLLKNGTPEQKAYAQKELDRINKEREGFKALMDDAQTRRLDMKTIEALQGAYYTRQMQKGLEYLLNQGENVVDTMNNMAAGNLNRDQLTEQRRKQNAKALEQTTLTNMVASKYAQQALGYSEQYQDATTNLGKSIGTDSIEANADAQAAVQKQKDSKDPIQRKRDVEVEFTRKLKIATDELMWAMSPFTGKKGNMLSITALVAAAATALFLIPRAVAGKLSGNVLGKLGKGIAIGSTVAAAGAAIYGLSSLTGSGDNDEELDNTDVESDIDSEVPDYDLSDLGISEIPEENQIKPEDQANAQLQAINKQIVESSKKLNNITKQVIAASSRQATEEQARSMAIINKYNFDPKRIETNSAAVAIYNNTVGDAATLGGDGITRSSSIISTFSAAFLNFTKALVILSGSEPAYGSITAGTIPTGANETTGPTAKAYASGKDVIIGNQRRSGGTLSWRTNNPGNNMYGELSKKYGAIGSITAADGEPVAIFPTLDQGTNMQVAQWRRPKYNNLTIGEGVSTWTAGNQSPTSTYAKDLARAAGATTDTVVNKLSDGQLKALAQKQAHWEGFKPGTVSQAKNGGLFRGPTSGYPMELHGTEIVIPMTQNSVLSKMATENTTGTTAPKISTVTKSTNSGLNQEMISNLAKKFDNIIYVLRESDNIHDKILRHSLV